MNPSIEPARFLVDAGDVTDFRTAISEIASKGYTEMAVRERLGLADITDLKWKALPIYRAERLAERDAQALAMELFLLQGAVPAGELHRLFSKRGREVLLQTGILEIDAEGLARARASIFPVGDRLIFSDHAWHKLPHPGYTTVPRDLVMFVGSDSRWLARATVRRPVHSALDLCTGSGVQALLAAPHARRVVAVDINPRAVQCARFNAAISGASNMEVAEGNLFEPVSATERFDLITANPPFVSSPVDELMFRDGGPSGEDIQRRIVAALPRYLAPGGIAQIVTELGEREGESIVKRVRQWLDGAAMDIHILRLRTYSAGYYAIGHAASEGGYGNYLESVGAWAANLRDQGYARIISVLIAFEWSDPAAGAPWDRVDESQPPKREAGREVEAVFSLERATRRNRSGAVDRRHVSRSGPIALTESRVLGSEKIPATARATLLGQALTVEYPLDPVERDILQSLDKPVAISDLLAVGDKVGIDREAVLAALDSLQRRGLVSLTEGGPGIP
ncbi:MAG TPA: methyltransferase [Bryobacteraceae bacterium]|jgi:SAM-dependent methyltransferase|nr:methyltransferase [Bryobacteraceae bacterium]